MGNFLVTFTSIFVALDVIGTVPMYLSVTQGLGRQQRERVVNTSMAVALGVALVFVFLGQAIFRHIGIQLFDFKIAGGLVLLLVSLADLVGGPDTVHRSTGSSGIVPLAVPLISGPGVLTTLMLQVGNAGYLVTMAALLLNYALAWVVLRKCDSVTRVLGKDGTVVLSKISALLLAAIAIAMVRTGVFEAIAEFRKG